jgi:chromosome segregation ATPase
MEKFPELEALVKRLQKELTDHLLIFKNFSEDTGKRITHNENQLNTHKLETQKKIEELEALIKALQAALAGAGKGTTTVIQSTDYSNDIKALQLTLNLHSGQIEEHGKNIKNLQALLDEIKHLKIKVSNLEGTAADHKSRIQILEEELARIKGWEARVISG